MLSYRDCLQELIAALIVPVLRFHWQFVIDGAAVDGSLCNGSN